jgi:hypothetical protein
MELAGYDEQVILCCTWDLRAIVGFESFNSEYDHKPHEQKRRFRTKSSWCSWLIFSYSELKFESNPVVRQYRSVPIK